MELIGLPVCCSESNRPHLFGIRLDLTFASLSYFCFGVREALCHISSSWLPQSLLAHTQSTICCPW